MYVFVFPLCYLYKKIYLDFGIKSDDVSRRVLVLTAVGLDAQELESREGRDLIYQVRFLRRDKMFALLFELL